MTFWVSQPSLVNGILEKLMVSSVICRVDVWHILLENDSDDWLFQLYCSFWESSHCQGRFADFESWSSLSCEDVTCLFIHAKLLIKWCCWKHIAQIHFFIACSLVLQKIQLQKCCIKGPDYYTSKGAKSNIKQIPHLKTWNLK